MSIPLFFAMTGQDIQKNVSFPKNFAWMSCHFSADGTQLSGIPSWMPAGSMLILDDRIPICGQDAAVTAAHMEDIVKRWNCSHVLLDLERPPTTEVLRFADALIKQLPCPVGIPKAYAHELEGPVFLPPVPPHIAAEHYLSPWVGREIWLEVALNGSCAVVTAQGCRCMDVPFPEPKEHVHHCPELFCHYHTHTEPDQIRFSFFRTMQDLEQLLNAAEGLGVNLAVGLHQELSSIAK